MSNSNTLIEDNKLNEDHKASDMTTNTGNKPSLLPAPPDLGKKIYIAVRCANANFTKWNGRLIAKWDMTAKTLADGVGIYEADLWIKNNITAILKE